MTRISIREQILNLILFLLVQLPLVHRVMLFNEANGFFYVGFILLLPRTLSRSQLMLIGFFSGLLVDVFTNTPGIHASASVFVMFVRNLWLNVINDDSQELTNLNIPSLRKTGFIFFVFPLILIHHFLIFIIENGGFHLFGKVISRILFSTIFTTIIVFVVNYAVTNHKKK